MLDASYTQQWCNWSFPPGSGTYNAVPPAGPDLARWNQYGGFGLRAPRLAFVDGTIDPWFDSGYHADAAAEPTFSSDPVLHPALLIPGTGHHWDSYGMRNVAAEPQFIREAHRWEIRTVRRWLREFPKWKPGRGAGSQQGKGRG